MMPIKGLTLSMIEVYSEGSKEWSTQGLHLEVLIGGSERSAARLIKIKPACPSRHAVQNVNTVAVL